MSNEEIKPIEIIEAAEQLDTQSVRPSQPQENQNNFTEAVRAIAQRFETLVTASEKANVSKEKNVAELQSITIDCVAMLKENQRNPSETKFCEALHLVSQINSEISNEEHVSALLGPINDKRADFVQKKQKFEIILN
jgi:hypothetical protein